MNYLQNCHYCEELLRHENKYIYCDNMICNLFGNHRIFLKEFIGDDIISHNNISRFAFIVKIENDTFRFHYDAHPSGITLLKRVYEWWEEVISISNYEFEFNIKNLPEEIKEEIKRLIIFSVFQ